MLRVRDNKIDFYLFSKVRLRLVYDNLEKIVQVVFPSLNY